MLTQFYPGDNLVLAALHVVVQVSLVLGAALVLGRLIGRRRAPVRHAICLFALAAVLLCLPLAWLFWSEALPSVRFEAPAVETALASVAAPIREPATAITVADPGSTVPTASAGNVRGMLLLNGLRHLATLAALVWLAGIVWGVVRLHYGCVFQVLLRRRCTALPTTTRKGVLAAVQEVLGAAGELRVVESKYVSGPVCVGWFRPLVVLPVGMWQELSDDELRAVLLHEGAHIVRRDHWVGLLQRVAGVVFWPHPLLHRLNRALSRAREEICDNYVLRAASRTAYARTLLRLTEQSHMGPAMVGLAHPQWRLEDRVQGILDRGRSLLTALTPRLRLGLGAGFLALVLALGGVSIRAADDDARPAEQPGAEPPQRSVTVDPPAPKSKAKARAARRWLAADWGAKSVLTQTGSELTVEVADPKAGKLCVFQNHDGRQLNGFDRAVVTIELKKAKPYPVLVSFAVNVGDDFQWIEAPPMILRPGTNAFAFNFRRADWKCKKTGWHHQTTPLGKGVMRTANLVFHGLDRGDTVTVKSLKLEAAVNPGAETPADAQMDRTEVPELLTPSQHGTPDLTRADILRVHVLNLLRIYAADLKALGRGAAARRVLSEVDRALQTPLSD